MTLPQQETVLSALGKALTVCLVLCLPPSGDRLAECRKGCLSEHMTKPPPALAAPHTLLSGFCRLVLASLSLDKEEVEMLGKKSLQFLTLVMHFRRLRLLVLTCRA